MSRFTHLHTHSHYSFLQALPKVDELVAKAKLEKMQALALTDAGNLHGAIEFYKEATEAGIKPILGVDAYLAQRSRHDRERTDNAKRSRLVLIAENMEGYRNLLYLITKSFTEGFTDRPHMDKELLRERGKGLIALIPSFAGDVAHALRAGDTDGAAAALNEYQNIFGGENVFLELTHHPLIEGHEKTMQAIARLGKDAGVPLVAQQDVYYLAPEDREATGVLRRIQHGERGRNEEEDFSFLGTNQIEEFFKDIPEAIENSGKIAERASVSFELGSWVFPDIEVPKGSSHEKELRKKVYDGIPARGLTETPELLERIEYELKVIIGKGFAPYFLTVSDLLTFAKQEGILTTTRGSAAGSIVAYLTGITNVSPLTYKLPFERFLNPERPKAPDIDMDFADNRRDEMIAYAKRKYGDDKVAQIGTFGTMMARAAVRDVARALGHAYGTGDRIAKLIPIGSQGFPMTIDRAFEMEPDLKSLYEEDDDVHEIIDIARRIEGCVRHVGVHAAGVVIAPTPLVEWTPLQPDPKGGKLITQYDMHSIEDAGLLKFDFLGIKNLSILADAVDEVRTGRGTFIDIENVPIDDQKTYAMLARGETEGIFQLNGSGITRFLKDLKPTTMHDINAMVALYRPGPMEVIPAYIERKNNAKLVKYPDPRMEKFLKESYGLLVYQDDLLYSAVELAGYSWLEVDKFRKAIGKKIPAEMAAQKQQFINGIVRNGQTPAFAETLWKLFEPFQAYGFNKAHAASYGKVAYQTAYMKANFPVEYMAAVLTADAGDTESIAKFVAECERLQIPVLPPDVNESGSTFTVVTLVARDEGSEDTARGAIRFGLSSIKNFGEGISEAIIEERTKHGEFKTLTDFLSRVGSRNLNRKSLESLAKCGALDRFAERGTIMANIETLLAFHKDAAATAPQDSLFGGLIEAPTITLSPSDPISLFDKLTWEKELLGIYVSGHPLDSYEEAVKKARMTIAYVKEEPRPGLTVVLPVLVEDVRSILTKSGEKMAFIKFADKTDAIEGVVFPKLFKQHSALFTPGTCVLIKAKVANRGGELSLALEDVKPL